MAQSAALLAIRYFVVDLFGGIIAFPLWWYTRGLAIMLSWALRSVRGQIASLGLGVWMKNLFVPMYGATDLSGKLISFGVRLVMIIGQTIMLFVWMVIVGLLLVGYLLVLPLATLAFLYHLGASLLPPTVVYG